MAMESSRRFSSELREMGIDARPTTGLKRTKPQATSSAERSSPPPLRKSFSPPSKVLNTSFSRTPPRKYSTPEPKKPSSKRTRFHSITPEGESMPFRTPRKRSEWKMNTERFESAARHRGADGKIPLGSLARDLHRLKQRLQSSPNSSSECESITDNEMAPSRVGKAYKARRSEKRRRAPEASKKLDKMLEEIQKIASVCSAASPDMVDTTHKGCESKGRLSKRGPTSRSRRNLSPGSSFSRLERDLGSIRKGLHTIRSPSLFHRARSPLQQKRTGPENKLAQLKAKVALLSAKYKDSCSQSSRSPVRYQRRSRSPDELLARRRSNMLRFPTSRSPSPVARSRKTSILNAPSQRKRVYNLKPSLPTSTDLVRSFGRHLEKLSALKERIRKLDSGCCSRDSGCRCGRYCSDVRRS